MFPNAARVLTARRGKLAVVLPLAGALLAGCSSLDPTTGIGHTAQMIEGGGVRLPQDLPKAPDTSRMRLVFADEFDGDAVDTGKWQTKLPWGRVNKDELQYYSPDALRVDHGVLSIVADREAAGGRDYTSGAISSYGKFEFTYGYVEYRARSVRGQGLWPAFWLMAVRPHDFNEIDIAEFVGQNPYRTQLSMHWGQYRAYHTKYYFGPDFSDGFHTHAVAWTPDSITWYVDGVERYRVTDHVYGMKMYLIANMAVGGKYAGGVGDATSFPVAYQIDYIRVYSMDASRAPSANSGSSGDDSGHQ